MGFLPGGFSVNQNKIKGKHSVWPFLFYLLRFASVFSAFYFGTLLIIGLSSEENFYSPFVAGYLDYIGPLRASILWCSNQLLQIFDYSTDWSDRFTLGITGGYYVKMVYSCVGYGVMSFWAAFVLANQGGVKKKVKWLVGGWCLLWVLNVLRIFFLILAINNRTEVSFVIDHHTVFNVVAYGFIFLLIYLYDRAEKHSATIAVTK